MVITLAISLGWFAGPARIFSSTLGSLAQTSPRNTASFPSARLVAKNASRSKLGSGAASPSRTINQWSADEGPTVAASIASRICAAGDAATRGPEDTATTRAPFEDAPAVHAS